MMLGKRPRPGIKKRTVSMSDVTMFDLNADAAEPPPPPQDHQHHPFLHRDRDSSSSNLRNSTTSDHGTHHQGRLVVVAGSAGWTLLQHPPRDIIISRTSPAPHFLQSCCLCRRHLVPGRDIYMYRGDSAFCSQECREQQMNQDERKEKCLMIKSKKAATSATAAIGSKAAVAISVRDAAY